jgi:hypothetical protein
MMGDAAKVIDWNGTDVPETLAVLPPGRYRIELVEEVATDLPPETQERIRTGIADVAAGRTVPWAQVDAELGQRIAARRGR